MIKKCNKVLHLDREKMSNQNHGKLYNDVLKANKSLILENNSFCKDLGNGYCKIYIINKNKKKPTSNNR